MPANPFSESLQVQVGGDASGATSALGGVQRSLLSTRKIALGLGGVLAGALAAKGIGSAISAAGDFNAAMTESLAIMGDVSETMREDMSEAAREVAQQTTFSADEAAESYFFLASAGLDAKESIAALPEVSQFAQAGMFDMATATDLLTDSASALGLEIDEYNRLADVLVSANQQANASVEQFASALTRQAATAMRSANIEVEEGVAVLAAWADQGIKGRRAGNLFRRTIDKLQESALKNAEEFDRFGISVFNAEGELRNMADIVEDMEAAFADMSAKQRAAALDQLGFSVRVREGILALQGNSEALREYQSELENAGGATEEVADKQLESFESQMKLLQSAIEDVKIEIGQELLPLITPLVQGFRDLIAEGDNLTIALGEEMQDNFSAIIDASMELVDPMADLADETLEFAANLTFFAEKVAPAVGPAILDLAFVLQHELHPAISEVNDDLAFFIEKWEAIPDPIKRAGLQSIAKTIPPLQGIAAIQGEIRRRRLLQERREGTRERQTEVIRGHRESREAARGSALRGSDTPTQNVDVSFRVEGEGPLADMIRSESEVAIESRFSRNRDRFDAANPTG